jgi:hypothetical protein
MTKDKEATNSSDAVADLFSYYNTTATTTNAVCNASGVTYVAGVVASFTGAKNAHAFAVDSAGWQSPDISKTSTIDTTGHNNAMHVAFSYTGQNISAGTGTQII